MPGARISRITAWFATGSMVKTRVCRLAEKMAPPVPSLNSTAVQGYTDGQLKWVIDNGIFPSGMPASKGILNDEEIWQIVQYIRHLPAKGSLGEAAVYGGFPAEIKSSRHWTR